METILIIILGSQNECYILMQKRKQFVFLNQNILEFLLN